MAWTTPRTWTAGETVTSAYMNAQIKDNLGVLGTYVRGAGAAPALKTGHLCNQYKSFGYSAGQGNAAGGALGVLSNFTWTMPANTLDQAGAAVELTSLWYVPSSAAITLAIGVNGTNYTWFSGITGGPHYIFARHLMARRDAANFVLHHGHFYYGAASAGIPTFSVHVTATAGVDWTAAQSITMLSAATAANSVYLQRVNWDIWGRMVNP